MISANEGLVRLREGNLRFASGAAGIDSINTQLHDSRWIDGQAPFAVVLGCSDSRVPVEVVFDQGFGSLFVIRVAGNIVAPSQIGSIEFAAERFGTRLVVVLGHTQCGAIDATLEVLRRSGDQPSPNLMSIVDRIRPSVEGLLATDLENDPAALARAAERANVRASVSHLRHGSHVLEELIEMDGLVVVGAEYSLETGIVDFFYGADQLARPHGA
jgi:carbonic anhydrase